MAGGGARRGTLVIHYGTGHRRPAPRPRQPRDGTGSCGSQPAYQSLLDRRLQRRPRPCAIFDRLLAAELIGRRTLMPRALETGHESVSIAAVRARTKSRIASCVGSGTHTAVSSPARCSRASVTASRRLVLTRLPARNGTSEGATTVQSWPRAVICRCRP